MNRLYVKNANQINISANKIDKDTALVNNISLYYSMLGPFYGHHNHDLNWDYGFLV